MSDNIRTLQLGRELFSFHSFNNWVAKAPNRYGEADVPLIDTVALDAKGRICRYGAQFMRARDDNAFPVTVYLADPEREQEPAGG